MVQLRTLHNDDEPTSCRRTLQDYIDTQSHLRRTSIFLYRNIMIEQFLRDVKDSFFPG